MTLAISALSVLSSGDGLMLPLVVSGGLGGANNVNNARQTVLSDQLVNTLRAAIGCSVTAAGLVVAACGNGAHADGTSNDAGTAGRSGVAGRAGGGASSGDSSAGGTSGGSSTGGTSGRGDPGGTSGAAEGGVSAAGAAGREASAEAGAGSVLEPNLPTPSRDCRAAGTEDCLSIAGTYDGKAVDEAFDTATCGSGGVHAGRWVIGCDHINSKGRVVLDVPIVHPGAFKLALVPATAKQLDFQYTSATATGVVALFAGNFVRAEVEGTVVVSSASSEYRVVSGTFHGVWNAPDSSCVSLAGIACASAELNVTFRLTTRFGSCFADGECTPPLTCDMVGFACFNK